MQSSWFECLSELYAMGWGDSFIHLFIADTITIGEFTPSLVANRDAPSRVYAIDSPWVLFPKRIKLGDSWNIVGNSDFKSGRENSYAPR